MTEKEFRNLFDSVTCSDTFTQRMESMLSQPQGAAVFSDSVSGVTVSQHRSRIRYAAIAACLLLVIGGGAGFAFWGRMQPANPTPVETSDTQESATESYVYPILTETIITETTQTPSESTEIAQESTQESTVSAENDLQTEAATSHRVDVTGTEATSTAGASAQTSTESTSMTIATEQHTTTTATTTTGRQGTTYNETTTTIHYDWAVIVDYDKSPMQVGDVREIAFSFPSMVKNPPDTIEVSASEHVDYEIDYSAGIIYVTALQSGEASLVIDADGAIFDSYVYLTIEGEGVVPDYATLLEYDKSPMKVGETRAIRYFHPLYPDTPTGTWLIDEVSDNISYQLDETKGYVYVTALAAGDAKIYIAADGCAFGQYAYLTIKE